MLRILAALLVLLPMLATDPIGIFSPRDLRLITFLLLALVMVSIHIGRHWHWSMGMAYAYIGALFLAQGMPQYGIYAMVTMTASLLVIPYVFKHLSFWAFENLVITAGIIQAAAAIPNLWGVYATPTSNPYYAHLKPVIGLMGQHTLLAPFLVFSLCFTIHRSFENRMYLIPSALILSAILISDSSMGYLSLAAAGAVFTLFHLGVLAALGLIAVSAAAVYLVSTLHPGILSFSGRTEIWKDAVSILKGESFIIGDRKLTFPHRPWFGYGTASWSVIAENLAKAKGGLPWRELHSDPLQALFEWGRIGMIPIILATIALLKKGMLVIQLRDKEKLPYVAGLTALLSNSLANFTLHITPHGQLALIAAFILFRVRRTQFN